MNEKINFLKFFMESGKQAEDPVLSERIPDFFPAIVYIYDVDSRKLSYANQKFNDYFGFTASDLRYADDVILNFVYKEDLEIVKRELENFQLINDNHMHCFSCRFKHHVEPYRYFKTSGTVINRNPEGKPSLVLFVSQDITDEVKTKEEVDTKNQLFRETEGLLQYGSWSWNIKTGSIAWTEGLYKILGYDPRHYDELTNEVYLSHVMPEYRSGLKESMQHSIMNKTDFDAEYTVKTRSGELKIVSTKGKVVLDAHGDVEKVLGITRDITHWRTFEREQERSMKELNRSNKELEEFAYVASHDLQEPLRKISMFSERLKSKCYDLFDKDAQLFMDRILASAGNMKTLIDNLLEFSRANSSSQAFESLELKTVFDQVISNLELKIEETKTEITFLSPLPKIEAVASEMEQLFSNLMSNAIKFRKENAIPKITVRSHKATSREKEINNLSADGTYYVIEFRDNGIGFETEYAEKIFQIFQRLHGKAEYPGSGIGLAICKRIVDNHNGVIYAQGVPDHGATFTIMLPEKQ